MLRKSKGKGHSLTINLTEEEVQQLNLLSAVRGGDATEVAKNILIKGMVLTDEEKTRLSSLLGSPTN